MNNTVHSQHLYLQHMYKSSIYDLSNSYDPTTVVSNEGNIKNRRIYIVRHGERLDYTFSRWIPHCFDETGKYMRKDSNMPKHLPDRINNPDAWLLDSPITNIGMCQAKLTGDAMKDANVRISYAYCSPAYRCVQTCHGILEGLGLMHIKIRVDFSLFEYMTWYQDNMPEFCSKEELYGHNYNIDMDYVPMMMKEELQASKIENSEQFYKRSHMVVENILKTHASGNVLIVGHATTLDSCTRLIIGRKERPHSELTGLSQHIPYCSMAVIEYSDSEWHLAKPCCYPITHNGNTGYEWDVMDN